MRKILLLLSLLVFFFSCTKQTNIGELSTEDNNAPVADFIYKDNIDEFVLEQMATDLDGDELSFLWSCSSEAISFNSTKKATTTFSIPDFGEAQDVIITLRVSDGIDTVTTSKTITIPELTTSRKWGLGVTISEEVSNNVDYDWYVDQGNTGPYSYSNCGPASVTMAVKWVYPDFSATCEDARATYRPDGGWWYTDDITNYLDKSGVSNYTIPITTIDVLKNELDNGNILIVNPDMYYIRYQANAKHHVDRFYSADEPGWGHFIVVKGYKVVDGNTFYEIYDPYGINKTYSDGSPKGIDRYYRAEDIDKTTGIWWDNAIVISKSL